MLQGTRSRLLVCLFVLLQTASSSREELQLLAEGGGALVVVEGDPLHRSVYGQLKDSVPHALYSAIVTLTLGVLGRSAARGGAPGLQFVFRARAVHSSWLWGDGAVPHPWRPQLAAPAALT